MAGEVAGPGTDRGGARPGRRWSPHRRAAVQLAVGLLVLDGLLLAADAAHRLHHAQGVLPGFAGLGWKADRDRSFAELFGYLKLAVPATLLVRITVVLTGSRALFAALTASLLVMVVDDAIEVHEVVGGLLADGWVARGWTTPPWLPLRSQDLGELTVWAVLGAMLGARLVIGVHRSSAAPRQFALRLALAGLPVLLGALVVDMVHLMVADLTHYRVDYALVWVEVAGELAGMSTILAVVFHRVMASGPLTSGHARPG